MIKDEDIKQAKTQNNILREKLKAALEQEKKKKQEQQQQQSQRFDSDDTLDQLINLDLTNHTSKEERWLELKQRMNRINSQDYTLPQTTPPRTTPTSSTISSSNSIKTTDHNLLDQINHLNQTISSLNQQLKQQQTERNDLIEEFQLKETKMISIHNKENKELKHKYNRELESVKEQLVASNEKVKILTADNQQYKYNAHKLESKLTEAKTKFDKLNSKYEKLKKIYEQQQVDVHERTREQPSMAYVDPLRNLQSEHPRVHADQSKFYSDHHPRIYSEQARLHSDQPRVYSDQPKDVNSDTTNGLFSLKPTGQVIDNDSDSDDELLERKLSPISPITQPLDSGTTSTQVLLNQSSNNIGNRGNYHPEDDTNYLLNLKY
ncbi:uncharacterized protein SPAPADRAFT_48509 [Spathaspora passalidarum NRRL Y-27907]|uniref:Uncharacterized protein n=1 Tax=Spathaspora passalidarum (strain NRRL Y-27907 / 11-Y1) TaxID=619300 RepID=G3AH92_SPAPN|nr:uncharacterized protein SPAPADRAFT_48509 [Spathaspora passalidarum NRRL Y-27907]EGW35522.1 hypothetical protein SPAPADRAFT_48509 [Spathaspora passalidarum NRRL Y-27907]